MTDYNQQNGNGASKFDIGKLTPTQKRLFAMLQDHIPHPLAQLGTCIDDNLADVQSNIYQQMAVLRKVLRPWGLGILCEKLYGRTWYSLVTLSFPQEEHVKEQV